MRISDCSSDVCSSDLDRRPARQDRSLDRGHRADRRGSDRDTGEEGAYLSRGCAREPGHYDQLKLRPDGPPDEHACRPDAVPEQELAPHSERRSEEHTSELQALMLTSYAVFCLTQKPITKHQ